MSKPLEESYKAELLQDIPDLWNRIEAGIEATATTQISDEITNNKENKKVSKKTSTAKKWRIFIAVASPALAACLLLVIIVPVAFSQFGAKDSAPMAVNGMEMAAPMEEDIAYESATTVRGEDSDAMMVQGDMAEEEAQEDADMPDFGGNSLARTFVAEVVSVDENMVRLRLEPAECQDLMNEFGIVLTEENLYECEISPDNEIKPRQGMHYTIRFNRTDGEFMEVIFVKENV